MSSHPSAPFAPVDAEPLKALLALWRDTRAPAVADALDRLDAQTRKTLVPLDAGGPLKTFKAWISLAEAKDPGDVPLLLPTLFDLQESHVRRKVTALHGFPPDPRLGRALGQWLLAQGSDEGCWLEGTPLATAVFAALGIHADASLLPGLREYKGSDAAAKLKKLEAAIAKQSARAPTPAERAWLNGLRFDDAPHPGQGRLVAAKSAGERAVAVDQLLEEADPRGEFVLLQQQKRVRDLTPKESRREDELHRKYAKAWMGPLARVLETESAVFEDGVLVRARADHTLEVLPEVIDAPEWSTLRALDFGSWLPDVSVLRRWPSIVEVRTGSEAATRLVAAASPPLEVATYFTDLPSEHPAAKERELLTTLPGLPKVTHFGVSGYWHAPLELQWLMKGAMAKRLRTFTLFGDVAVEEFVALMNGAPATLERGVMRMAGGQVEVTRDSKGGFCEVRVSFLTPDSDVKRCFNRFLVALRATPKGVVRGALGTIEAPSKLLAAELAQVVAAWSS